VGAYHRVRFSDLPDYETRRDAIRWEILGKLAIEVDNAGLYDSNYQGEE